jgi:hypothetical protein
MESQEWWGNASTVVDHEKEGLSNGPLPSRPRGHNVTKANLRHDAFAISLSETLKGLMPEKEGAVTKRNEKRRREK